METAYLLLGGNCGDRETILRKAMALLNNKTGTIERVSSFFESQPWGMLNVQNFLNIAIKLSTKLTAFNLLDVILLIEEQLGRKRNPLITEYQSRPIDIDILFYGSAIIQSTQLTVPHPRLQLRKFVLVPLCEIAAEFVHPVLEKTILNLLKECPDKLETVVLKPYIK